MSVSLAILILLILGTAAVWVFTQNKQTKSIFFPVTLIFLYILFWKIAGPVFTHFFLITGFLIVISTFLYSPNTESDSYIRSNFQFKLILTLGTIVIYIIALLLVFTDAARQSGSMEIATPLVLVELFDFAWIYIIVLALFSIQLFILMKGIFKTDE